MSDFKEQMGGLIHGKNEKGGLYALLIGMALGNIIPSISDGYYFFLQKKLRDQWKNGEITAKEYWTKNSLYYYLVPCSYWIALSIIIINVKGDATKKLKMSAAAIGAGAVLAIILKMVQTDKKQLEKEDAERANLIKDHPEVFKVLQRPEYSNIAGQIVNSANDKAAT